MTKVVRMERVIKGKVGRTTSEFGEHYYFGVYNNSYDELLQEILGEIFNKKVRITIEEVE